MSDLARLVSHHWLRNDVRAYLATLNGAAPDMIALRSLGVPQSEAVAICSAWHKPEPALEKIDRSVALLMLHSLCEQIDAGRGDITVLVWTGFSEATAAELSHLINCAHSH